MDDTSPGWRKKSIAVFFTECWNFSFFYGIMIKKAGQRHLIFGQSHIAECAARFPIDSTAQIPIGPALAALCDQGGIEVFTGNWLDQMTQFIVQ